MVIKGKTEELLLRQLKPVKGICKNSMTPSKDKTRNSWALKRRRGASKKIHNIFDKIIAENFPNLEKTAHLGTGSLQDTKQT
jgi:hypothetical protein